MPRPTSASKLVRSGYLKGIIGLPANLFYGTGIPACIVVLDKENAAARKGIFMIDASKGFIKDGPRTACASRTSTDRRHLHQAGRRAALRPHGAARRDRRPEERLQPQPAALHRQHRARGPAGHRRPPARRHPGARLDALELAYWKVLPGVRGRCSNPAGRPGYARLRCRSPRSRPPSRSCRVRRLPAAGDRASSPTGARRRRRASPASAKDGHPKALIETIAEDLLAAFRQAPLLDAYDVYQHLMDYWAETMQDDAYLIAADGWVGAQPREIVQVKDKNNKLTWPEPHDYLKGKRRFKSDLVPAPILVARYFAAERDAIEALDNQLATLEQQLDEMREENSGEDGLLAEVIEGEGDKQKIAAKAVKARLKEIGKDPLYADERAALEAYADLLEQQTEAKARRKAAQEDLDKKIDAKYPKLTEAEIKTLVVDDKWMARLSAAVQGELDRVSQTLTGRIRELAERYATPLPKLTDEVETLAARVEEHLKKMGAVWK
jgi:type I restriction enzyme M protein